MGGDRNAARRLRSNETPGNARVKWTGFRFKSGTQESGSITLLGFRHYWRRHSSFAELNYWVEGDNHVG